MPAPLCRQQPPFAPFPTTYRGRRRRHRRLAANGNIDRSSYRLPSGNAFDSTQKRPPSRMAGDRQRGRFVDHPETKRDKKSRNGGHHRSPGGGGGLHFRARRMRLVAFFRLVSSRHPVRPAPRDETKRKRNRRAGRVSAPSGDVVRDGCHTRGADATPLAVRSSSVGPGRRRPSGTPPGGPSPRCPCRPAARAAPCVPGRAVCRQ